MELDLFFGGTKKTYIVSKYIKKFIIPLDRIKDILKERNGYELMKMDRKGKIFNCVIMTDEQELAAVVEAGQVSGGVSFMAKRKDTVGFSRMIIGADYSAIPRGVLTLILKLCDKQGIDGYYLNSFWGYPVLPEPFGKFESMDAYNESQQFWKTHMFRADDLGVDWDTVLMDHSLTKEEINIFYQNRVKLSYIGKADIQRNFKRVEIDPSYKYFAYRGYYVE